MTRAVSRLDREEMRLSVPVGRGFKIHKSAAALYGALLVVTIVSPVFGNIGSVTGKLIDLACYSQNKEDTANGHNGKGAICAQACAREGFAVGLLTTDGKVYQVTGELAANSNARLVPHMGHAVTIAGEAKEKDGQMMIFGSDLKMVKQ
jgi:hypothetical protein